MTCPALLDSALPPPTSDEVTYRFALFESGLSAGVLRRLCHAFRSAQAAFEAPRETLALYLRSNSLDRFCEARAKMDLSLIQQRYADAGITLLWDDDPRYPALLRQSHMAPWALSVMGNIDVLSSARTVGIVGTRRCTPYAQQVIEHLMNDMAPHKPCIISGLALGVDTLAHNSALYRSLPTIAVLGTGLGRLYPKSNQRLAKAMCDQGGAVVSEYPLTMPGDTHTFPQRNRIIAGLSEGVLIVEAPVASGALITAQMALDEGRTVMAVPGSVLSENSAGCLKLIKDGAFPITTGNDIAYSLGWTGTPPLKAVPKPKPKPSSPTPAPTESLSPMPITPGAIETPLESIALPDDWLPLQHQVWQALTADPMTLDALCEALRLQADTSGIDTGAVLAALTLMELSQHVVSYPGLRYCRSTRLAGMGP